MFLGWWRVLRHEVGIINEIDGWQHEALNKEYDETRTKYLENQGFYVLRIDNEDVNYDYNYAIFKIREICEKQAEQLKIEFIDKTLNW